MLPKQMNLQKSFKRPLTLGPIFNNNKKVCAFWHSTYLLGIVLDGLRLFDAELDHPKVDRYFQKKLKAKKSPKHTFPESRRHDESVKPIESAKTMKIPLSCSKEGA